MQIKIYTRINEVEKLWKSLYKDNQDLSWFQSYEWNQLLETEYDGLRWTKYLFSKLRYVVIKQQSEGKNSSVIVPIIIRKKNIYILGQHSCSDYLSTIHSKDIQLDILVNSIKSFYEYYHGFKIIFDKVNESSLLCKALNILSNEYKCSVVKKGCVYISLYKSKTFYETLSKSVRQNYRTSKNRLLKNGHSYNIRLNYERIDSDFCDNLKYIYLQRRSFCEEKNRTWLYAVRILIKKFFAILGVEKRNDIVSDYSRNQKVIFGSIYIDDSVAAFFIGQYNNNKECISVCRVSTNINYYKYSPGQILLIEALEGLRKEISYFDLTRGDEDYKYKLGGKTHNNFLYSFQL